MDDDLKALRAAADRVLDKTVPAEVQGIRLNQFRWEATPATIKRLLDRLEAAEMDAERKNSALSDAERVLSDFYANAKVRGCESAYKHFQDAALKCQEAARAAHQQEDI